MKIKTNNVPRLLLSFFDLPVREQNEYDYLKVIERYDNRFVRYKGSFYDVFDSQTTHGLPIDSPLKSWDSFIGESYFSGVVFRFVDFNDKIVVGSYAS